MQFPAQSLKKQKTFSHFLKKKLFLYFRKRKPRKRITDISGNGNPENVLYFGKCNLSARNNKKNPPRDNLLYFRKRKPPKTFLYFLKRNFFLYLGKWNFLIFQEAVFFLWTFHGHICYFKWHNWIKNRGLWEVLEPITETFNKTSMGNLKSTER